MNIYYTFAIVCFVFGTSLSFLSQVRSSRKSKYTFFILSVMFFAVSMFLGYFGNGISSHRNQLEIKQFTKTKFHQMTALLEEFKYSSNPVKRVALRKTAESQYEEWAANLHKHMGSIVQGIKLHDAARRVKQLKLSRQIRPVLMDFQREAASLIRATNDHIDRRLEFIIPPLPSNLVDIQKPVLVFAMSLGKANVWGFGLCAIRPEDTFSFFSVRVANISQRRPLDLDDLKDNRDLALLFIEPHASIGINSKNQVIYARGSIKRISGSGSKPMFDSSILMKILKNIIKQQIAIHKMSVETK